MSDRRDRRSGSRDRGGRDDRDRRGGEERRSFKERSRERERRDDRDKDRRGGDRDGDRRGGGRDERRRSRSPAAGGGGGGGGGSGAGGGGGAAGEARMKQRPSGFDQKQMMPENFAMQQIRMGAPPPMVGGMAGKGGFPGAGGGGGGMPGAGMGGMAMPPTNTVTNPEVELFLQHNPVEPHAATRLRSLPVELQKIVLSRGSLFGGRDPTAVLLGRVRAATRGVTGPQMGGSSMPWSGTTAEFLPPQAQPQIAAPQPQGGGGQWGQSHPQTSAPMQQNSEPQAAWATVNPANYGGSAAPGGGGSQPGYQSQPQQSNQPLEAWETFKPEENKGFTRKSAKTEAPEAAPPPPVENEKMVQLRGQMQSSLGALSESLLGKTGAAQAGFVDDGQLKLARAQPNLGPFRSKARPAPVATEPEPAPMDLPVDINLMHTPAPAPMPPPEFDSNNQQPPQNSAFSAPPPQFQEPQQQLAVMEQHSMNDMGSPPAFPTLPDIPAGLQGLGMPPGAGSEPAPPVEQQRLWAPSAQDLADLNVPPGIAVRMVRQNQILADEDNMPIIPYEGGAPAGAPEGPEETEEAQTGGDGEAASPAKEKDGALLEASAVGDALNAPTTEKGAAKKAQAIATLSFYGLTDPNSQEDVAKAVQAVAAGTGDQATAVALWHMIVGSDAGEGLTDEQIEEVQQAAQHAQYSQYWLQQQFQSQLAMFENQRLMATGDNPVNNVDDARESALRGPRGDPAVAGAKKKPSTNQPMLPGDWTCPGCGDHQFARNRVCRFCGASRPLGSA